MISLERAKWLLKNQTPLYLFDEKFWEIEKVTISKIRVINIITQHEKDVEQVIIYVETKNYGDMQITWELLMETKEEIKDYMLKGFVWDTDEERNKSLEILEEV